MLTSIIDQGNQLVNDKLGIVPIKSNYSLYTSNGWIDFCTNRNENPEIESLYLPRTYSAHLKDKTDFLDIYLLHEYFGHGLFCEYSKIGRKIVKFEKELAELEKLMLGVDELPENQKITITSQNPYFRQYQMLRKEFQKYSQEHSLYYEGFAYWLQADLSKLLNLINKWEELKEKLPRPIKELSHQVEEFIKTNGEKAFLEIVGLQHK